MDQRLCARTRAVVDDVGTKLRTPDHLYAAYLAAGVSNTVGQAEPDGGTFVVYLSLGRRLARTVKSINQV